jgi:hypothetical protein
MDEAKHRASLSAETEAVVEAVAEARGTSFGYTRKERAYEDLLSGQRTFAESREKTRLSAETEAVVEATLFQPRPRRRHPQ